MLTAAQELTRSRKRLHQQAKVHVEKLKQESEDEEQRQQANARHDQAHKRSAGEREERIRESLRQVDELHQQKEDRKKGDGPKARCSTTDPGARKMKMADGGLFTSYSC